MTEQKPEPKRRAKTPEEKIAAAEAQIERSARKIALLKSRTAIAEIRAEGMNSAGSRLLRAISNLRGVVIRPGQMDPTLHAIAEKHFTALVADVAKATKILPEALAKLARADDDPTVNEEDLPFEEDNEQQVA